MSTVPDVTFLTPAFQAEATLGAALECLLAQASRRAFEVIVIDDGSADATRRIAEDVVARDGRVRVIAKANGGEASALNAGWREARGRLVGIVEGDVELAADWLEVCAATLEAEADVFGVGGALVTPREDSWIARLAGYEIERKFASKPREAEHLTSANVLYRREAFDLAGPFDERLVNASLDSVFNARLRAAGKRLVYEPRARARHHYKATFLGYLRRQYAYARYRVHNKVRDLYPADRFLAWHVALAAAALALSALAPLFLLAPPPACLFGLFGPVLFGLALLAQLPAALRILILQRDPVAVLHPPVAVLRNALGAVGYAVGVLRKATGGV